MPHGSTLGKTSAHQICKDCTVNLVDKDNSDLLTMSCEFDFIEDLGYQISTIETINGVRGHRMRGL